MEPLKIVPRETSSLLPVKTPLTVYTIKPNGGVSKPASIASIPKIAKAYGMDSIEVPNNASLNKILSKALSIDGPLLINVHMKQESQIYPKLLFGKPIEDSHPLFERDDFYKQMIVKPIS